MKKTILALVIASASFTASAALVSVPTGQDGNENKPTKPGATMTFKEKVDSVCGIVTKDPGNAYHEGSIKFNDEDANGEVFVEFTLATNDTSKKHVSINVATKENTIQNLTGGGKANANLWLGTNKADASYTNAVVDGTSKIFPINSNLKAIAVTELDSTKIAKGSYTFQSVVTVSCSGAPAPANT
ncbi:hypothetical protein ACFFUS_07925 [Vibrio gallaecicus]|uniref:hypothetical protein n=1 Tax=Vibrio gallaecicus TaxID=552386 RepID=UPI0010C9A155|nr:hypothetical protein [Vibrio gallaecicus]MDN3616293.1 hypothetical protein [Vibrio gallaecicus]